MAGRIEQGHEEAVRDFAEDFGERFRRLFSASGLWPADAEELAVDCVSHIAMSVRAGKFEPQGAGSFPRWSYTVASHMLTDWYRRQRRRPLSPAEEALRQAEAIRQQGGCTELRLTVREAMGRLSKPYREILAIRHYALADSFREIGRLLDITAEAARVRYHRAKIRLAEILEPMPVIQQWLEGLRDRGPDTPGRKEKVTQ